jgi:cobyrinic acid a,c-diamide synthase
MSNGILIASPHSGSGKTVVTLGLLRALSRISNVRAAKSGPDYIDPRFHEIASGNQSLNLDTWAMSESRIKNLSSGKGTLLSWRVPWAFLMVTHPADQVPQLH